MTTSGPHQACQLWSSAIRHAVLHGTFDGVRGYLDGRDRETADYWGPLLDEAETGSPTGLSEQRLGRARAADGVVGDHPHRPGRRPPSAARAGTAVRAGHDTDTTAAIAGALLGARWGASAVPARWRRILHGWPGLRAKDLIALAARTANGGRDDDSGWPSVDADELRRLEHGSSGRPASRTTTGCSSAGTTRPSPAGTTR